MAGVAMCALALLALAGCGPVSVDGDGPQDPAAQQACRDLIGDLPEQLGGGDRTPTTGNDYAAAWSRDGAPPVVLRCGVPEPAELTPISRCDVVDDVDWFAPERVSEDQTLDATLTTVGREPRVEVTVPAELRPPVDVLADLAPVVRRDTRELERCR